VSSTHLGPKTRFLFLSVSGLLIGGALSDKRVSLSFTVAVGLRQHSHYRIQVPQDSCSHFTVRFQTSSIWRSRSRYLYPAGIEWPSYNPRHSVPFSLPPSTHRATVDIFKSASKWGLILSRVRVRVTLWLVVYRQSVCLGAKPLEAHDQIFLIEPLWSESLCNILSDKRMGLSFTVAASPH
jgi:hypothetical protein